MKKNYIQKSIGSGSYSAESDTESEDSILKSHAADPNSMFLKQDKLIDEIKNQYEKVKLDYEVFTARKQLNDQEEKLKAQNERNAQIQSKIDKMISEREEMENFIQKSIDEVMKFDLQKKELEKKFNQKEEAKKSAIDEKKKYYYDDDKIDKDIYDLLKKYDICDSSDHSNKSTHYERPSKKDLDDFDTQKLLKDIFSNTQPKFQDCKNETSPNNFRIFGDQNNSSLKTTSMTFKNVNSKGSNETEEGQKKKKDQEEVLKFQVPFFNDDQETESENEKKDEFESMDEVSRYKYHDEEEEFETEQEEEYDDQEDSYILCNNVSDQSMNHDQQKQEINVMKASQSKVENQIKKNKKLVFYQGTPNSRILTCPNEFKKIENSFQDFERIQNISVEGLNELASQDMIRLNDMLQSKMKNTLFKFSYDNPEWLAKQNWLKKTDSYALTKTLLQDLDEKDSQIDNNSKNNSSYSMSDVLKKFNWKNDTNKLLTESKSEPKYKQENLQLFDQFKISTSTLFQEQTFKKNAENQINEEKQSTPRAHNKRVHIFYEQEDEKQQKKVNLLNELDLMKNKRDKNDNEVIQHLVDSQIEALQKLKNLSIENQDLYKQIENNLEPPPEKKEQMTQTSNDREKELAIHISELNMKLQFQKSIQEQQQTKINNLIIDYEKQSKVNKDHLHKIEKLNFEKQTDSKMFTGQIETLQFEKQRLIREKNLMYDEKLKLQKSQLNNEQEIQNKNKEIKQLNEKLKLNESKHSGEIIQLRIQKNKVQQENEKNLQAIKDLEKENLNYEEEVDELEEEIQKQKKQVQEKQKQIEEKNQENQKIQKSLQDVQDQKQSMLNSIKDTDSKIKDNQTKLSLLMSEIQETIKTIVECSASFESTLEKSLIEDQKQKIIEGYKENIECWSYVIELSDSLQQQINQQGKMCSISVMLQQQAQVFKNNGNEEFKKGNYQRAIELFSSAIDIDQSEPSFLTNRAMAYLKLNEYSNAQSDCNSAILIDDKFSKAYYLLSKCQIFQGQIQNASSSINLSIELDQSNENSKKYQKEISELKVVEEMVNQALKDKSFERAIPNLDKLLEKCIVSVKHICLKIECLLNSYKFQEALKFSQLIISKNFDRFYRNPRILFWLGRSQIYSSEEEQGKKTLNQALQYDPELLECEDFLKMLKKQQTLKDEASQLFKDKKFQEAIQKYDECSKLDQINQKFNSTLFYNKSICFQELKDHEGCLQALDRCINLNDSYTKAYIKRGETYMTLEDYEEALKDFNHARDQSDLPGDISLKLKIEEALKLYKKKPIKDLYKILNVSRKAEEQEIKKAYKAAALKWHPDKNSESVEQMAKSSKLIKKINEAMEILGDKQKRAKYDRDLELQERNSGGLSFTKSNTFKNQCDEDEDFWTDIPGFFKSQSQSEYYKNGTKKRGPFGQSSYTSRN